MPDGVYTVTWRTVSKTDGHVTAGAISFGVGVPQPRRRPAAGRSLDAFAVSRGRAVALLLGARAAAGRRRGLRLPFAWTLPPGGRALLVGAWIAAAIGVVLMTVAERSTVGLPRNAVSSVTGRQLIAQAVGVGVCGRA
jgi:hypothetical protein